MTLYFRRRWEESRGDAYDSWGPATYYFETTCGGDVLRQVEVYDNGPDLRIRPSARRGRVRTAVSRPARPGGLEGFGTTSEAFEQVWNG